MVLPTELAPLAIVPVALNWPVNGVTTISASGRPDTVNGPRAISKLRSALVKSCDTGFCGLPERLRGACASSASRIAASAIAAGASTVEVPVSGCNGGTAVSAGRPCCNVGADGHSRLSRKFAPRNETTTTAAPTMIVRIFIARRQPAVRSRRYFALEHEAVEETALVHVV